MPIYEYRCNACGHEFEEWQKMSDDPIRTCPACKARKVEKLISHSSFQLKGSGWYATDYGKRGTGTDAGGKKKAKKADKDTDGTSGASGGGGASSGGESGSGAKTAAPGGGESVSAAA